MVSNETFLAGYGLAQAVPGPLFTFAAYLGAVTGPPPNGLSVQQLPSSHCSSSMLLVYGVLPFWDAMRTRPPLRRMRGTNAAVVAFSVRPLQSGLRQCGADAARFCARAGGLPASYRLEVAALGRVVLLAVAGPLSRMI